MQEINPSKYNFLHITDQICKDKGIKLSVLAKLLEISRASIFNYRTGKSIPPDRVMRQIIALSEDSLNIDLDSTQSDCLEYKTGLFDDVKADIKLALDYLNRDQLDKVNILGVASVLRKAADDLEVEVAKNIEYIPTIQTDV